MHFRNFNYSFSSLIACVADSDVFNQAETRVCFIFCFICTDCWDVKSLEVLYKTVQNTVYLGSFLIYKEKPV